MSAAWLLERMAQWNSCAAVIHQNVTHTYGELLQQVDAQQHLLVQSGVEPGDVVLLEGDLTPQGISLLLALAQHQAITAPLRPAARVESEALETLVLAQWRITADAGGAEVTRLGPAREHRLYARLHEGSTPGLVIFTSGSTGQPRAVVHDLGCMLNKFTAPKRPARTLAFLLFDHVGGLNTVFQTFANGGTLVVPTARDAETVAESCARHGVELLPVSPSFLNLMLMSGAVERHNLQSVSVISYGTEPMPGATFRRAAEAMPWVRMHQLYGMSEVGILQSTVRPGAQGWVKLGGLGVQTRVVDGILQLRAPTTMLGYLNAPDPFTPDGWLNTGDEVDVDGDWVRIRGRRSEMINVGGQKVAPAEVEDVVATLSNIADVVAYGEPHAMLGQVVCCRVNVLAPEEPRALRTRLRAHCLGLMEAYKAPVKVEVAAQPLMGGRMKKVRP